MNIGSEYKLINNSKLHVILATIIGLGLRLYKINDESFWLAEAAIAASIDKKLWLLLTDNIEPVYFLIIKIWGTIFGNSEISLRLVSVISGTLAIPAYYFLSVYFLNTRASLIGTYLLASNPFAIYCSQEAKFYSFFLYMSIITYLFFIKAFRESSIKNKTYYITSALIAFNSHPYGIFLFLSLISSTILFKSTKFFTNNWQELIKTQLTLFCLNSIFILKTAYFTYIDYKQYNQTGEFELKIPDLNTLLQTPTEYFFNSDIGIFAILLSILLVLLNYKKIEGYAYLFICIILFSIIIIPWIISIYILPIFYFRFTVAALIAVLFLASSAINSAKKHYQFPIAILIILLNLYPLNDYYSKPDKELWREATVYLTKQSINNKPIVVAPGYLEIPLKYYLPEELHKNIFPLYESELSLEEIKDIDQIWLVESYGFFSKPKNTELLKIFNKEIKSTIATRTNSNSEKIVSGYPIKISLKKR